MGFTDHDEKGLFTGIHIQDAEAVRLAHHAQDEADRLRARRRSKCEQRFLLLIVVLFSIFGIHAFSVESSIKPPHLPSIQQCAITNFHSDLSFLDNAPPITPAEFILRRDRLARALHATSISAFVLEPGYTFQYYGNISQPDWEPWEPEERPFLMLIQPQISVSSTGKEIVIAKTSFLAPHFEEGRVRMLGIPSNDEELDIVIWEEHWDPYTTLKQSHLFAGVDNPTLMVDEELRDYISRGLSGAGFTTVGLSPEAELVRQIKSPAEIGLLRAVNSGTVAAIRAMRPCLEAGLTEDEVRDMLDATMRSVGFEPFFDIVLFEEHGALPHGGFVTGGKRVTMESMVVIDVGAHWRGYSSDVCRSFFIDPIGKGWAVPGMDWVFGLFGMDLRSHEDAELKMARNRERNEELWVEKLKVWDVVLEAQNAAKRAFRPNGTAASVDIAARTVIEEAGYGFGFTHRVGHGIGIKAHESPYLNKWNTKVLLQPGMVFTDEPGIYLEGKFGIRHEDIYLVTETGEAELLSGRLARGPYDP